MARPVLAQSLPVAVTPTRLEFDAAPGAVLSGKLQFWNGTASPLPISLETADFAPSDEEGHVDLGGVEAAANSLKTWVKLSEPSIVIDAGKEPTLDFFILVPANAEPGTHWGAILVRAASSVAGGGSAIEVNIGAIVLVRVSGAVTEKLALESFGAPALSLAPPVVVARVRNLGNVHVAPKVLMSVRNIWGDEVATSTLPAWNVLPDAVRRFDAPLGGGWWLGPYSASMRATYGNGQEIIADTRFWVVPSAAWWGLAAIAALCVIYTLRRRFAAAWRVLRTGA